MNIQYKNILIGVGIATILLTSGIVFTKNVSPGNMSALSFLSSKKTSTVEPIKVVTKVDEITKRSTESMCGLATEWSGFNYPEDVASDNVGNIYVLDKDNVVTIIDTQGNKKTFGSPGSGDGQFNVINKITLDSKNNIYVADFIKTGTGGLKTRIQMFNSQTNYITSFYPPASLREMTAYDYNGDTYLAVVSYYNLIATIKNPSISSNEFIDFTSYPNFSGQYSKITGITNDSNNLYVLDGGRGKVVTFNFDGSVAIPEWGKKYTGAPTWNINIPDDEFYSPTGIAVDEKYIYIADAGSNRIYSFDKKTRKFIANFDGKYGDKDPLTYIGGINIGSDGNIYFTDTIGNVMKYTKECAILVVNKDFTPGTISTVFPFSMIVSPSNPESYNKNFDLYDNGKTKFKQKTFFIPNQESLQVTEKIIPSIEASYSCTQNGKTFSGKSNSFFVTATNSEKISCTVTNKKSITTTDPKKVDIGGN